MKHWTSSSSCDISCLLCAWYTVGWRRWIMTWVDVVERVCTGCWNTFFFPLLYCWFNDQERRIHPTDHTAVQSATCSPVCMETSTQHLIIKAIYGIQRSSASAGCKHDPVCKTERWLASWHVDSQQTELCREEERHFTAVLHKRKTLTQLKIRSLRQGWETIQKALQLCLPPVSLSLSRTFSGPSDLNNMCWLPVATQWKRLPLAECYCYKEHARQTNTLYTSFSSPLFAHTSTNIPYPHCLYWKYADISLMCQVF